MPEPAYLVCARRDAEFAVRGSSFDEHCSRCGAGVMVAPSGQRRLKRERLPIICFECWKELVARREFAEAENVWAGPPEEALDFIQNPYRRRN
jgi:hypothetical protein